MTVDWYLQQAGKARFVITDHSAHIFSKNEEDVWWAWADPNAVELFQKAA